LDYSWVKYDKSIPSQALTLKNSEGNTLAVCRGEYKSGVHPGYVNVNEITK